MTGVLRSMPPPPTPYRRIPKMANTGIPLEPSLLRLTRAAQHRNSALAAKVWTVNSLLANLLDLIQEFLLYLAVYWR